MAEGEPASQRAWLRSVWRTAADSPGGPSTLRALAEPDLTARGRVGPTPPQGVSRATLWPSLKLRLYRGRRWRQRKVKMRETRPWAGKQGTKRGRKKRTGPPGKGRQWSVPGTPPQKPLSTQMPFAFLPQQEEKLALWDYRIENNSNPC